jgi:hypothetical protein
VNKSNNSSINGNGTPIRLTVAALAKSKRLSVSFLKDLGLHDLRDGGVGIPYLGVTGEDIAVKQRTAIKAKDGSYWPKGKPLAAYGQWRIPDANKYGFLIIVEGESDCWALWHNGFPALGIPGANAAKTLEREHIEAVETIYVVREPDKAGEQFVAGILNRLAVLGFKGRVFELTMPAGVKDPADLHVADPSQFRVRINQAINEAKSLPQVCGAEEDGAKACVDSVGLVTTSLDTIQPAPIRWLVPGYFPLGKLILLAGDGGHGKSTLTLDLAACISTGRPCFGLAHEPLAPAEVLLISCEDDFADTVVPRLLSAGADLTRIRKVDGILTKDGKLAPFSLAHFERMEQELIERPGIRLVVIDPAGAYVGRSGVDDYNDSELRSLLGPMAELAARQRVTIVLIKHLVKGTTAKAVHKVGGSAGYVNTVRAAFVIAPDGEETDKKLFLPIKFNLGPRPGGLAYYMSSLEEQAKSLILEKYAGHLDGEDRRRLADQLFRIEWAGPVDADADRVLADQASRERGPNKVQKCMDWLTKFLGKYAFPSDEIKTAARKEGFTFDNVKEAKAQLKDNGLRNSNRGRLAGAWWSGFGDPSTWVLRPGTPLSPFTPHTPHTPHTPQSPRTVVGVGSQQLISGSSPIVGSEGSVGSVGTAVECAIMEGEL